MRQLLIMMALMLTLAVGCTQPESEQPIEATGVESSQEDIVTPPKEALSTELQQTILEAVGEQQNLPLDQLQIDTIEAADWPDACLGMAAPDEFCAQMITPGWAVTVTDGQRTWRYRTNLEATQVRLADIE